MNTSGHWIPEISYKVGDLVVVTDSRRIFYAKIIDINKSIKEDPVYQIEWICQRSKIRYGKDTYWVTSNEIQRAAEA